MENPIIPIFDAIKWRYRAARNVGWFENNVTQEMCIEDVPRLLAALEECIFQRNDAIAEAVAAESGLLASERSDTLNSRIIEANHALLKRLIGEIVEYEP